MHKVIDNGKSVLLSLARAVSASLLKKAMWMFLAMLESRLITMLLLNSGAMLV